MSLWAQSGPKSDIAGDNAISCHWSTGGSNPRVCEAVEPQGTQDFHGRSQLYLHHQEHWSQRKSYFITF